MNEKLENNITCEEESPDSMRIKLENVALSIVRVLSDDQLVKIMEEMK